MRKIKNTSIFYYNFFGTRGSMDPKLPIKMSKAVSHRSYRYSVFAPYAFLFYLFQLMIPRMFLIATFGTLCADTILIGVKTFPPEKLVLICYDHDGTNARRFSKAISSVHENIEVVLCLISGENIIDCIRT